MPVIHFGIRNKIENCLFKFYISKNTGFSLFFSDLYTKRGARTHSPEIKSCMFFCWCRSGAPKSKFFYIHFLPTVIYWLFLLSNFFSHCVFPSILGSLVDSLFQHIPNSVVGKIILGILWEKCHDHTSWGKNLG